MSAVAGERGQPCGPEPVTHGVRRYLQVDRVRDELVEDPQLVLQNCFTYNTHPGVRSDGCCGRHPTEECASSLTSATPLIPKTNTSNEAWPRRHNASAKKDPGVCVIPSKIEILLFQSCHSEHFLVSFIPGYTFSLVLRPCNSSLWLLPVHLHQNFITNKVEYPLPFASIESDQSFILKSNIYSFCGIFTTHSTLLHWKSLFWAPSWGGTLFLASVSSAFKQPTVLGITNTCWEWLGTGWSDVCVSTHLTLRTILRCVLTENEGVNSQSWVQVSIVSCLVVHLSIFPTASPHSVLVGHLWTQSWVSDSGGKMRSVLPALLGLRLLVRADVYTHLKICMQFPATVKAKSFMRKSGARTRVSSQLRGAWTSGGEEGPRD